MIAKTCTPPYYAVIFSSFRTDNSDDYKETLENLMHLASDNEDFLGMESARDGFGISVSYWKSMEGINKWKNDLQHIEAKKKGVKYWYKSYMLRIAKVEYDKFFTEESLD